MEKTVDDAGLAGVRRVCLNLPGGSRENLPMEASQGQIMFEQMGDRIPLIRSLFDRMRAKYKGMQFGVYAGSWHQRSEWALGKHGPLSSEADAYERAAVYLPVLSLGIDFIWIDALTGERRRANGYDAGTLVQDRRHWQPVVRALKRMSRPYLSDGKNTGREVMIFGEAFPNYDELRESDLIECFGAKWNGYARKGRRGQGMANHKDKLVMICTGMKAWEYAKEAAEQGWSSCIYTGLGGIGESRMGVLAEIVKG